MDHIESSGNGGSQKTSGLRSHMAKTLNCSTFFALRSGPALHADLGPTRVTVEMAKEVIPAPAELVAQGSVVVRITTEAKPVFQTQGSSVVTVRLPLFSGVQHGGEEDPLDQLTWGRTQGDQSNLKGHFKEPCVGGRLNTREGEKNKKIKYQARSREAALEGEPPEASSPPQLLISSDRILPPPHTHTHRARICQRVPKTVKDEEKVKR